MADKATNVHDVGVFVYQDCEPSHKIHADLTRPFGSLQVGPLTIIVHAEDMVVLTKISDQAIALRRALLLAVNPTRHRFCTVCKQREADPENGIDTCDACGKEV
jgi:hypothetical protein